MNLVIEDGCHQVNAGSRGQTSRSVRARTHVDAVVVSTFGLQFFTALIFPLRELLKVALGVVSLQLLVSGLSGLQHVAPLHEAKLLASGPDHPKSVRGLYVMGIPGTLMEQHPVIIHQTNPAPGSVISTGNNSDMSLRSSLGLSSFQLCFLGSLQLLQSCQFACPLTLISRRHNG